MKVLKFGGKSLALGDTFDKVIEIIRTEAQKGRIAVVVSAIGDTTDTLDQILNLAATGKDYQFLLDDFKLRPYHLKADLRKEFQTLDRLYEGVSLLGDYSLKVRDEILAQGEIISGKVLCAELQRQNLNAFAIDSREFIVTDDNFGEAQAIEFTSRARTRSYFKQLNGDSISVVTGFIGSTENGETSTLGRNGSNYTAALLANFLEAEELRNYTHVDGIFTANPDQVRQARKIEELNFNEANELANFGASILHAKTILPLVEKEIPLRILNTLNPTGSGTLISSRPTPKGIKSLSIDKDVALIRLIGRGLLGKVGVDARIFTAMAKEGISIGVISQGSSERGLGFLVKSKDAENAILALHEEFKNDFFSRDVSEISADESIAVISIIGQDLSTFDKAYSALIRNRIVPVLFNNSITGNNVSIVVHEADAERALNTIHGRIFGVSKTINLAIFGHGLVGSTLIDQIIASAANIEKRKGIRLNIFAVGNSRQAVLSETGIEKNWRKEIENTASPYTIEDVIAFADKHHLENLIAVDNTASGDFIHNYIPLVKAGFDLISSNKIANTAPYTFYNKLRNTLKAHHKEYLYEANVGAGLPLIDTIKLLHLSGENITGIRGVFSGSLSYIFNTYSESNKSFSTVLKEAMERGYTEPDAREDLSGNDVGRKLLILARELDLRNEFDEVVIENLIPRELRDLDIADFLERLNDFDTYFEKLKQNLKPGYVLKYIGELSGDLQQEKGNLSCKLVEVPADSALGQLKGSDNIFEIYTESYGDNPLLIQGAGAGASVTARGVFGDILRLAVDG